ncbi:MAG TPA: adenylyl-sulfate kinase [Bryobacteraceae bacterium]|nr:adenylyl-sulfate kinase [Bryobacteraceae bacterium]
MPTGVCIWFTGLPCAGKTTLADHLSEYLRRGGEEVVIFDGDAVRMDVSSDLGFSREHRHANALRVAAAARAAVERGAVAICALVSPYCESRRKAREVIGEACFFEIYVDTPLETCEARDVKGMYRLAHEGKIEHFTGVSDPYEPPVDPEVRVTGVGNPDEVIVPIVEIMVRRKVATLARSSGRQREATPGGRR